MSFSSLWTCCCCLFWMQVKGHSFSHAAFKPGLCPHHSFYPKWWGLLSMWAQAQGAMSQCPWCTQQHPERWWVKNIPEVIHWGAKPFQKCQVDCESKVTPSRPDSELLPCRSGVWVPGLTESKVWLVQGLSGPRSGLSKVSDTKQLLSCSRLGHNFVCLPIFGSGLLSVTLSFPYLF